PTPLHPCQEHRYIRKRARPPQLSNWPQAPNHHPSRIHDSRPSTPQSPSKMPPKARAPEKPSAPTPAAKPSSTGSKGSKTGSLDAQAIVQDVWGKYVDKTPQRVKLLDCFMGFLIVVGVLQFVYCLIVGNFPFNAFLAGFSATVGQFVLTASLRMQTNPENKAEFESISHERAFADFVFGSLILHFFCINFIN
ncbi:DAD-domain-containing protein, partial [Bimuria novae-zelandiae CBS 107.79]